MRLYLVAVVFASLLALSGLAWGQGSPGGGVEATPGPSNYTGRQGVSNLPPSNGGKEKGQTGTTPETLSQPTDTSATSPAKTEYVVKREVFVREIRTAFERRDFVRFRQLEGKLKSLDARVSRLESNPLGGTEESHEAVREWMADNGYTTSQQARSIANEEIDKRLGATTAPSGPEVENMFATERTEGNGKMTLDADLLWWALAATLVVWGLILLGRRNTQQNTPNTNIAATAVGLVGQARSGETIPTIPADSKQWGSQTQLPDGRFIATRSWDNRI